MHNLKRLEVHGIKVLTTRQLAEAYETERKVINNNYLRNKDMVLCQDLVQVKMRFSPS